ncbi:hypothetical protein SKAU_G00024330 [Synaphobranchus kaupii]|uniref:Uncharacterized protein n=1 Tax=Synaphobranchus kaupii TaxID=118154 RepID=A0A9Q1GDS1_SYNKA|nr:hypothetical protein SKAU_G00024330 [Synaphobranchus kaupii]
MDYPITVDSQGGNALPAPLTRLRTRLHFNYSGSTLQDSGESNVGGSGEEYRVASLECSEGRWQFGIVATSLASGGQRGRCSRGLGRSTPASAPPGSKTAV